MISELFKKFSTAFKKEVNEKYSGELKSYQLLVKQAPAEIRKIINDQQLKIEGSIGRGNTAYYPWIGIFDKRVSTGATNGFYIVFLFSDDYDHVYLTLNQGSTQQTLEIAVIIEIVIDCPVCWPNEDGFILNNDGY